MYMFMTIECLKGVKKKLIIYYFFSELFFYDEKYWKIRFTFSLRELSTTKIYFGFGSLYRLIKLFFTKNKIGRF